MRTTLIPLVLMALCSPASGDTVQFDWVTIGNPGNANDTESSALGGVDYVYRISKHEVTNQQYAVFLGKVASSDPNGLFHPDMDITRSGTSGSYTYIVNAGFETKPVTHVSFFDAMRFTNWMENGQGSAGTESGVYTIGTGVSETRSLGATYFIPTLDEWYKAAYYDPTLQSGSGGYWDYPTKSDVAPTPALPSGGANVGNMWGNGIGDTTDVGAYPNATSYFGAFDLAGNVWEWNESVTISGEFGGRGLRGGSWGDHPAYTNATSSVNYVPTYDSHAFGLRLASVPEPSSLLLAVAGVLGLLMLRFARSPAKLANTR